MTGDFPLVRRLARSSAIGRASTALVRHWTASIESSAVLAKVLRASRHNSLHDSLHNAAAAEVWRVLGVITIIAGVTHLVATRWQAPHQVPLAAPAVAAVAVLVGLMMIVAGAELRPSWRESTTRRIVRRLFR
jgi:hypothetical protein